MKRNNRRRNEGVSDEKSRSPRSDPARLSIIDS